MMDAERQHLKRLTGTASAYTVLLLAVALPCALRPAAADPARRSERAPAQIPKEARDAIAAIVQAHQGRLEPQNEFQEVAAALEEAEELLLVLMQPGKDTAAAAAALSLRRDQIADLMVDLTEANQSSSASRGVAEKANATIDKVLRDIDRVLAAKDPYVRARQAGALLSKLDKGRLHPRIPVGEPTLWLVDDPSATSLPETPLSVP